MKLFIYSAHLSPRLEYILEYCFKEVVQLDYEVTNNQKAYRRFQGPCLNYSNAAIRKEEVRIPQSNLLSESLIQEQNIEVVQPTNQVPYSFDQEDLTADYSFDLLACCFYHLSRYEEYLPFESDSYGRFPANGSLAYRFQFLDRPIVDEWCLDLVKKLKSNFKALDFSFPTYQFKPSYDIDLAWAFRHRPFHRHLGSMIKDLGQWNTDKILARIKVWSGQLADPFDRFDYLDTLHDQYQLSPQYFFHLGDFGKLDRNISPDKKALQHLLKGIANKYSTAIHPSYKSNFSQDQLQKEIDRYTAILGIPPQQSRQHYLYLRFPDTYQQLLKQGIKEDFSLGYAHALGFRSGVARAHYWFDLSQNKKTDLRLYPFAVMDVTLRRVAKNDTQVALQLVKQYITKTREVNGQFISLWHNSSFATHEGWAGWDVLYEQLIQEAII